MSCRKNKMNLRPYLIIISICATIIFILNLFFVPYGDSFVSLILWAYLGPLAIIVLDLIVAGLLRHTFFPKKWFDPYKKNFHVGQKELSFYRRINLNKIKPYVPDTGKLMTGLSKSSVESTQSQYLYRFLVEACYGEAIHLWIIPANIVYFLVAYFLGIKSVLLFTMIIPQILVNIVLNLPPVMIQRSNRPKMLHIYERQVKKESSTGEN